MTATSGVLLDTHVFLWWRGAPDRIAPEVARSIAAADLVFVSVASAWEAAIKTALGKLELGDSFEAGVAGSEFLQLPIAFSHCALVASLPQHHRDPFDRMLVAQARAEGLTLVTADPDCGRTTSICWRCEQPASSGGVPPPPAESRGDGRDLSGLDRMTTMVS